MDPAPSTVHDFPKFQQRCICGCCDFYSRESTATAEEVEIMHSGLAAIVVTTNLNAR
jgi:hypothetical protein